MSRGHRSFVVVFGLAFLALLGWMYAFDGGALNHHPAWPPGKLLLLRLVGSAFLSLWLGAAFSWMRHATRTLRGWMAAWSGWCLVLFLAAWPGYLMSDSLSALQYGFEYPMDLWLGFFKPFLYSVILQVFPHVAAITFLQLMFVAAMLAYATEVILVVSRRRRYAVAFFVLMAAQPAVVFNMALLTRDTLFSVIVLWVVAFIVKYAHDRQATTPSLISRKARDVCAVAGPAVAMVAVFAFFMPFSFGSQGDGFSYKVANTLNPLGYVLQNEGHTDAKGHLGPIGLVVDVKKIKEIQTPYEIPYWWSGGGADVARASPEAKAKYMAHVFGFLKENAGIYVAGRWETLRATTGYHPDCLRIIDMYRAGWPVGWVPPAAVHIDPKVGRPFPLLSDGLQSFFERSAVPGWPGTRVFWNFLPALGILLAALLFRFPVPGMRLAALIVLARVPVVFLAAPASQYKYYLSVQLCGVFVLLLVIATLIERRPAADT
jgi:hypothetical protein